MTTAVETRPEAKTETVELPAFQRPPISIGQTVLWYPDYEPSKSPHICTVSFVGPEVVELVSNVTLVKRDSVRHMKDPTRLTKPVLKRFGGWDYTQEYKDEMAFRNAVGERLAAFERDLEELKGAMLAPTSKSNKKGE